MTLQVVLLYAGKCLRTQHVLDAAGVLTCGVGIHTHVHKKICNDNMLLISSLGDGHAGICKGNVSVIINNDHPLFTKTLHGHRHGRLGKTQHVCDVDGTNHLMIHGKHQDTFQIILRRFVGFVSFHSYHLSIYKNFIKYINFTIRSC